MGLSPKTGVSNGVGVSPSAGVGSLGISAGGAAYTGPLDQEDGFAILTEDGDTLAWESI